MSPLTLSYRRAEITGFWVMLAASVFVFVALAAAASSVPAPWAWGLGTAVLLPLPRALRADWFEVGIWVWNGGVRRLAAALRAYTLRVTYYLLCGAAATGGSTLELRAGAENTLWRPRTPRGDGEAEIVGADATTSWSQALLACARWHGNRWMVLLVPVIWLLTVLREDGVDPAPPTSTYTLY